MPLENEISEAGKVLTISVQGEFDQTLHDEFCKLVGESDFDEYIVDLKTAVYMDSSALGMLLLLREHAHSYSSTVNIINANHRLNRIFSVAKFDQLFSIQQ